MKTKNKNNSEPLDALVSKYLEDNPEVKESLSLFNISNEQYKNAIASLTNQNIKISTTSTSYTNG